MEGAMNWILNGNFIIYNTPNIRTCVCVWCDAAPVLGRVAGGGVGATAGLRSIRSRHYSPRQ
ncbi:hypothetical protein KGM_215775 [Danaus plexippus plexippus]|uniref:Uncharacterized protein n=1 Tax=Danaus plexippus plexippus TaxID=278856 RepID=A0A212ELM8_DANPL|nr:hypothetical protein KGM_215775 [Danaus plexippus plexippus]